MNILNFLSQIYVANIISILGAVITLMMVILTYKSVRTMNLSRKETNSAHVIVYFKTESHDMYLVVENTGKSLAKNVKINFNPDLINSRDNKYVNFKYFSYLPPNFKIKTVFDSTPRYLQHFGNFLEYHIDVDYINIYGENCHEEYDCDLNYLNDLIWLG